MSTFRDFAEKLAERGVLPLKHSGRSTFVELSEAGAAMVDASPAPETEPMAAVEATPRVSVPCAPREIDPATASAIAEGVELVRHLLANAPQPPRWPIYLRQFKQFTSRELSRVRRPEIRLDRGLDARVPERRLGKD